MLGELKIITITLCRLTITVNIAISSKIPLLFLPHSLSISCSLRPKWFHWKMSPCTNENFTHKPKIFLSFSLSCTLLHSHGKAVVCKFNYISHMISRCLAKCSDIHLHIRRSWARFNMQLNYYLWNVIQLNDEHLCAFVCLFIAINHYIFFLIFEILWRAFASVFLLYMHFISFDFCSS